MKVLVLGASGMLGNAMVRVLEKNSALEVYGSIRSKMGKIVFPGPLSSRITSGIDVENASILFEFLQHIHPEVVINCIGLVKQLKEVNDPIHAISINSLLPYLLARECANIGARLIHFSTDCVFSGKTGNYSERDEPDAQDLYGRSKLLGEVDYPHAVTLRTSIIGHELASKHGLIEWFLSQEGKVKGYTRAMFSGLPTCELARVINEFVLPSLELRGVYHVGGAPISKYDLLTLVDGIYDKGLEIIPDDHIKLDRSLDSTRFSELTGYVSPEWTELVTKMHDFQ